MAPERVWKPQTRLKFLAARPGSAPWLRARLWEIVHMSEFPVGPPSVDVRDDSESIGAIGEAPFPKGHITVVGTKWGCV